jgi:GT2 family glycosyltransferase
MSRLAVQVILYKSSKHLEPLLDSLKAQTYRDVRFYFYENSEDAAESMRSKRLLESSGLEHELVIAKQNIGFAGGHVEMYRMHSAPFVMLLNDDAKLESTYLEHAMNRIQSDGRIASVTGLVYRWDGKSVDTSGLIYKCMAQVVDRQIAPESAEEVFGVSGAIGMYRRSAIEKAGGLFDPAWFMYKEDADLAIRLKRAGFTAWYEPQAIAWHKRGFKHEDEFVARFIKRFWEERKRPARQRQYAYVNQHHIYTLHAAPSLGFVDFLFSLIHELGRTFLVFVTSPIVWLHSIFSLAKSFPRMWKRRKELEKLGLPHCRMLV